MEYYLQELVFTLILPVTILSYVYETKNENSREDAAV